MKKDNYKEERDISVLQYLKNIVTNENCRIIYTNDRIVILRKKQNNNNLLFEISTL